MESSHQCTLFRADQGIKQGGVTRIDPIVTAATALVNLYTKEGVESLHILPYTSVNVRVVNGQWLKFKAVNGQSPKINMVNGQMLVKVLTLRSQLCDYRVYGSDTPLIKPISQLLRRRGYLLPLPH